MDYTGKVAWITGASSGIGAALARELAARGAHVILTARTAKDLESVEDAIFEAGGSATIAPLDLTEPDAVSRLAAAIAGRCCPAGAAGALLTAACRRASASGVGVPGARGRGATKEAAS